MPKWNKARFSACRQPHLAGIAALCMFPVQAYAYLDPGTGSFLLQTALAVIAGAAIAIKAYWYRLKIFFSRLFGRAQRDSDDTKPDRDDRASSSPNKL